MCERERRGGGRSELPKKDEWEIGKLAVPTPRLRVLIGSARAVLIALFH